MYPILIVRLYLNGEAQAKVANRAITPAEIGQATSGLYFALPNPAPRATDSMWVIAPTTLGRMLTIVLDPHHRDGEWHVRTAWDSTPAQTRLYRNSL